MSFRHLLVAFLYVLPAFALGQTPPSVPSRQWQKIASLPPGTALLVREQNYPFAVPCALVWIDNASLACDHLGPDGNPQRVIYPATSVISVARMQTWQPATDGPHATPILISMGLGALLGGLAGRNTGAGGVAAGAAIGGSLGGGIALAVSGGFNPTPRQGWQVRVPLHALRMPLGMRRF